MPGPNTVLVKHAESELKIHGFRPFSASLTGNSIKDRKININFQNVKFVVKLRPLLYFLKKGLRFIEVYSYVRVSSIDQNEDRQMDAMNELGIPKNNIFIDKQSGKDFDRPAYQALIKIIKSGDLLYIKSIDRLGRNYEEVLNQWRFLTKEREIDIVVLDMPLLDTRSNKDLLGTLINDLILTLLSYVAQNERETIHQRQAEGIAAAKARGVVFGRPIKRPPKDFPTVVKQWERGEITIKDVLGRTGLKRATFYNRLREFRGSRK